MLKPLRYALATLCFAASLAAVALWAWSAAHPNRIVGASWHSDRHVFSVSVDGGETVVSIAPRVPGLLLHSRWQFRSATVSGPVRTFALVNLANPRSDLFGIRHRSLYFPLWYPALILALAGVAALKLNRRFTLRSAIIATTVVAGLLGMAVAL